jgi:hypothetical protein
MHFRAPFDARSGGGRPTLHAAVRSEGERRPPRLRYCREKRVVLLGERVRNRSRRRALLAGGSTSLQLSRMASMAVFAILAACGDEPTNPNDPVPVASLSIGSLPDSLLTRQTLTLEIEAFDRQGNKLNDRPVV